MRIRKGFDQFCLVCNAMICIQFSIMIKTTIIFNWGLGKHKPYSQEKNVPWQRLVVTGRNGAAPSLMLFQANNQSQVTTSITRTLTSQWKTGGPWKQDADPFIYVVDKKEPRGPNWPPVLYSQTSACGTGLFGHPLLFPNQVCMFSSSADHPDLGLRAKLVSNLVQ